VCVETKAKHISVCHKPFSLNGQWNIVHSPFNTFKL